jgi:DNA-binding GntR family transcriptional regulator
MQVWSADFPADDWRNVSSARVYDLAIQRLEAKGKGILLLHDIQARTVAALPRILHELKARGYRIVHVVPATPDRPATPTEPQQWQLHPPSETVAISRWPKIPNDPYENRDDHAVLVLFEEIQREIDQGQEHEVGEESIGVAQKQHEDAPGGLGSVEL